MEFRQINEFGDLINSEGTILSIVENVDDNEATNERLWIKGNCLNGKAHIYAKVNDASLEMFFQGRISVKELFLLRKDENFIMEINDQYTEVFSDEEFENNVINTIECGGYHYYSLNEGMRVSHPFTNVLQPIRNNYSNGIVSISTEMLTGNQWINENL